MTPRPPEPAGSTSPAAGPPVVPYGSWPSPITTDLVLEAAVRLGDLAVDGEDVWWDESRPDDGGRVQVVRRRPDGATTDVLPAGYAARTRVHEYGGGAWWVHRGTLYFANWDDQRLHRLDPGASPVAITRPPVVPAGLRYADGVVTPDGRFVICVRESHEAPGEPVNEVVAVPTSGGDPVVLDATADFVAAPRLSPDGRTLAWIRWYHPRMPWEGTELVAAAVTLDDADPVRDLRVVAGGPAESITGPAWSGSGHLHFLSDRTGWWTIHRCEESGRPPAGGPVTCLLPAEVEVGVPHWVFGPRRYAVDVDGSIVAAAGRGGVDELLVVGPEPGATRTLEVGLTSVPTLALLGQRLVVVGSSFTTEPRILAVDLAGAPPRVEVVRDARPLGLGRDDLSVPTAVTFPTGADHGADPKHRQPGPEGAPVAHGLFYPPANPGARGPRGTPPPLLVAIHGGPTSVGRAQLQLSVQFWTSRGWAVLDVNHRGSTGYGRPFRQALDGAWGLVDVEDCAAGARWLAAQGMVDPARMAIHGGSAGGFTTLCALARTEAFAAGCSSYGVTDLEALARDTHKFESRYLDTLIGPYPAARATYLARSPLSMSDAIDRPVLFLQGLEDEVVPPAQTEAIVAALAARGVPHVYLAFEGEQHGFRQADTIRTALEAELAFYGEVFGFVPADPIDPELLAVIRAAWATDPDRGD